MKKDIKDYLHLYIGGNVLTSHAAIMNGEPHVMQINPTNLFALLYKYKDTKPILRPLSDMTEDEIKELFQYEKISKEYRDIAFQREIVMNNVLTAITIHYKIDTDECGPLQQAWTLRFSAMNAHDCKWLLSKGFDLFGLIEAGLAIDKTTLKQKA